ncbi:ATP-dependent helicase [Bacillus atrophaeus]|uniref:ATP-dependent helicase n=1 Tax=Bacillus atrophaeus TaxID=1452 RepID=UPI002E2042B5|nr:ATP-dependent helicase [Bacillus atrophaeus]
MKQGYIQPTQRAVSKNLTATKSRILEELNEDQQQPVINYQGPSFVVAGPGSGKTHTIVSRAAYMIEEGVRPENVLLFTFTRKAAGELKERIEKRVGKKADGLTVGTYHSICSRLLRKYATYIGYENNFSIYDEEDKGKLLKKIVTDDRIKHTLVASYISDWKNKMISPTVAIENAENTFEDLAAGYYQEYQRRLKEQNAFDFDDLIYATIRLLSNHESVLREITERYHYIMADEFQDSSDRDVELIKLLGGERENVCMILDDEQSIYGFRGASVQAVLRITDHFVDLREFILRQNYRSTKTIVGAARSLIQHNTEQIEKDIFTENEDGEKIVYFETANPQEEAVKVVKVIMGLTRSENFKKKDIAILYRMSYLSRAIEEALLKNGISYTVVGGVPFYARKEVKDIMSYVRFVYNPQDVQAFDRIINTPKRGIGKKGLENIHSVANSFRGDKIDLIRACKEVALTGKAKKGIEEFNNTIEALQQLVEEGESPETLIKNVVKLTGYKKFLLLTEKDADERIANVIELQSIAGQYDNLEDFIYNMALNSDINEDDEEKEEDRVQLLTMHSSKGLEFKTVLVVGVNEGIIPHWKADTLRGVEEERRLFYVAMTRAEKMLFITRPRITYVNGAPMSSKESKFIGEIDKKYILKTK